MKKAIITGANGFVGNSLVKELLKQNVEVIALDMKDNNLSLIDSDLLKFVPHNLKNNKELLEKIKDRDIDIFYHFAWIGSAGEDRANYSLQLENAKFTMECIEIAKKIGCKRFVCAGSIMEHETISATYTQGNKPGLGYIYGSGKLVAHTMGMSVATKVGIDLVWAKITNAYGVGELSPRFLNTTIRKIINREPLQFTSGSQNYDFIYVDDVARAFYLIGKNGKAFHHYLIGSSTAKPLKEFILQIKKTLAPEQKFIFGDIPFSGINLSLEDFDCSLTEKDTGFVAQVSFEDGIQKTMEWLIKLEGKNDSKI